MKRHIDRFWLSLFGKWDEGHPDFDQGGERRSGYKGYWFELGHSFKNIFVEALRSAGIWDRGNKLGRN